MKQTAIFIVGDSGAGKSFLVAKALEDPELETSIHVVPRCTTRRPRTIETNPEENAFLDENEFQRSRSSFSYVWWKEIPGGHGAWYAFRRTETKKKILVYPANLQFLQTAWETISPGEQGDSVILRVDASLETRRARILQRDSVSHEELNARLLGPPEASLLLTPHVVLRNDICYEETALFVFLTLMKGLLYA